MFIVTEYAALMFVIYHKNCTIGSVKDVSRFISSSETNDLYDIVTDIKVKVVLSLKTIVSNKEDLNQQKKNMLN